MSERYTYVAVALVLAGVMTTANTNAIFGCRDAG